MGIIKKGRCAGPACDSGQPEIRGQKRKQTRWHAGKCRYSPSGDMKEELGQHAWASGEEESTVPRHTTQKAAHDARQVSGQVAPR